MVGFMMRTMILLAMLVPAWQALPALAQESLPDPTRPGIAEKGLANAAKTGTEEEVAPLRLESVLLGKQRQQAIISGKIYQLGQTVGDAKLVKINPQEVHLLQNGKTQKLALFPGVEKKLTVETKKTKREKQ